MPKRRRRPAVALLALLALVALGVGVVVGGDEEERRGAVPEASEGQPVARVSFLARIVPPPAGDARVEGPAVPRSVADLARRLPLERKVAQLFLLGFRGTGAGAEIFERLRRLDLGGLVLDRPNYVDPALLGELAGKAVTVARRAGHVPPWVLAIQEGGERNAFPDLPPALAPADLASPREAAAQASDSARALRGLGLTGVLGPVVDVGVESGGVLGARVYSDVAGEVAGFASATVRAYRRARIFSAVKHLPGIGAADQPTETGPATVGLGLPELRERDLDPFEAAISAGVPGVVIGHALYAVNDFTRPASLSPSIVTDLLRRELGFQGVAVTDDLADPAVAPVASVPDAAVQAVAAGADLLFISGPPGDQQASYAAVLGAARSREIPRERLDQAVLRGLLVKRDYGLIR